MKCLFKTKSENAQKQATSKTRYGNSCLKTTNSADCQSLHGPIFTGCSEIDKINKMSSVDNL